MDRCKVNGHIISFCLRIMRNPLRHSQHLIIQEQASVQTTIHQKQALGTPGFTREISCEGLLLDGGVQKAHLFRCVAFQQHFLVSDPSR